MAWYRRGIAMVSVVAGGLTLWGCDVQTVECFGNLCPPGTQCVTSLEQCASVEQIRACEGAELPEGSACRFGQQQGVCQGGVCAAGCGDGLQLDEEVCDGDNVGAMSCLDLGYYSGTLSCSASCDAIDSEACVGLCGDGELNGPEFCDTSTLTPPCALSGYDRGVAECGLDCQWPTSGCAMNNFSDIVTQSIPARVRDIHTRGPGRALLESSATEQRGSRSRWSDDRCYRREGRGGFLGRTPRAARRWDVPAGGGQTSVHPEA